MNLKGSKRGRYMEDFGRRKGRGNDSIAILKAKKKISEKGTHKLIFFKGKKKENLKDCRAVSHHHISLQCFNTA